MSWKVFLNKWHKPLLNTAMCLFVISLSVQKLVAQQTLDISKIKQTVDTKAKSIIDSIRSNHFQIKGSLQATSGYVILANEKNTFDYSIAANLLISYKGLKLPFSYRYSNGRSITRFGGSAFRTPSFQIIGLSPTYKGVTFHFGDRMMDFSKYSYQNLRFSGLGIETQPKGFYLKAMSGVLKAKNPIDHLYKNQSEPDYRRKSFGGLIGFHSEKFDLRGIVFSANDDYGELNKPDSGATLPKENTVLSYQLMTIPHKKIKFELEQSFSALTRNAFDPRIDIPTHQTTYNMFGLFEKKASSEYFRAFRTALTYNIGDYDCAIEYELLDKGYLSLGSTNFDHNFRDFKFNVDGQMTKSLMVSSSLGLRTILEKESEDENDSKFIINTTINYAVNNQINLYSTYSNFKTSLYSYYRSVNAAENDTVLFSQSNNSIMLGSNYILNPEKPTTFSLVYSYQSTNTIEDDAVQDKQIDNTIINLTVTKSLDKHNISLILGRINTHSSEFGNRNYFAAISHSFKIKDRILLNESFAYNHLTFNKAITHQITFRQSFQYQLYEDISIQSDLLLDASNKNNSFKLHRAQITVGSNLKF